MQDRPTAPELLDALATTLFMQVREWVPRERRFQILVAANVCAVLARELRAGYEPALADARLFRELLGRGAGADPEPEQAADAARASAAELARAIRAGELDAQLPETIGRLRDHVSRKLAVARPGYDDPDVRPDQS